MATTAIKKQLISLRMIAILIFVGIVCMSPLGDALESTLIGHVLVEIPLYILAGYLMGVELRSCIPRTVHDLNSGGIAGILLATFVILFWMIPRWLDESLVFPGVEMAKVVSLVFVAGVPLGVSWSYAGFVTRGLVKLEFLAMLFRLGWLYLISPQRLCNSYLVSDQIALGEGMLTVGVFLAAIWLLPLFISKKVRKTPKTRPQSRLISEIEYEEIQNCLGRVTLIE